MKFFKVLLSTLLLTSGLIVLANFASAFFFKNSFLNAYIVTSGSMEPAIKTGSLVFSLPSTSYYNGDVITYKEGKKLVTHRVEARIYENDDLNNPLFLTSGDANKDFDRIKLGQEQIVGKVVFSVPYLGYTADFAKTPKGFILFVIIPATIIVYEELKYLFGSIKKNFSEKLKKRKIENDTNHSRTPKSVQAIIPIFGAVIVFAGLTGSYFSDTETSSSNVIQAGEWVITSPSPSPAPVTDHLVINEVMFDPDTPLCTGGEPASEWVEIFNPTPLDVNLNGWTIADNTNSDSLPNVTIPAGAFAIVTNCDQTEFTTAWSPPAGTVYIDLGSSIGNALANGGDEIKLIDGSATTVDHVSYGTNTAAFNPSVAPPAGNHSIEREPDGIDTNTATDFVDRPTPSPGS